MSSEAEKVIDKIRDTFKHNFEQKGELTVATKGGKPGFNACRLFIRNFRANKLIRLSYGLHSLGASLCYTNKNKLSPL